MISLNEHTLSKLRQTLTTIQMARATEIAEMRAQHLEQADVMLTMALGAIDDTLPPPPPAGMVYDNAEKRAWDAPIKRIRAGISCDLPIGFNWNGDQDA